MPSQIPQPHSSQHLRSLIQSTPARLGVWRAGTRPLTSTWLKFRLDHALARDAVKSELSEGFLEEFARKQDLPLVQSLATSRADFILFPPKGKRLSEDTLAYLLKVCPSGRDVQVVISDGLSARAVEENVRDLLPMLLHGLSLAGISTGKPVLVRYGRVAVGDQIARALKARLAINLIGERPGLSSSKGLSAYLTYMYEQGTISSDRTVVSNIHDGGTPAVEAGAFIVDLATRILKLEVSGVALQKLS